MLNWGATPLARAPRAWSGRALLAHVSVLYYLEGQTQDEIARRLQLSRAKVSRLLSTARDTGIARIFIRPPPGVLLTLETELETRFGLREVRIVPSARDDTEESARWKVGAAAASDLARSARVGQTVGLIGMDLIACMVDAVGSNVVPGLRVVQGVGWERGTSEQRTLMDLVLDLARRIEGSAVVLPAPFVVDSEQVRSSLAADPQIGDALRALDALDTLYTEIVPAASSAVRTNERPTAAGQLALRHFDCRGQMLGDDVDGHLVGLSVEQLHRARHVVALAHGQDHAPVFAAALLTRLVGTLITDEVTARAIVELPSTNRRRPS